MEKVLIATYGSLRKGFHNHICMGENPTFKGNDDVFGVMYLAYSSYPHLYHESNKAYSVDPEGTRTLPFRKSMSRPHRIEIYEIDKQNFEMINRMEIGAGYEPEIIDTEFGKATIWFTIPPKNSWFPNNLKWIEAYTKELIKADK